MITYNLVYNDSQITDVTDDYIETAHNYYNNQFTIYSKTISDADELTLTFSNNCYLESSSDYVMIYDKNDNLIYNSKGRGYTALRNKVITVSGDTVKIVFITNNSNTYWGFRCDIEGD
jgi:hypothetical protein